jgi:MRC1-like domain
LPRKASEFLEGEAEQSEDEYMGSGDEDEDGLDEIRQEDIDFQDNRYFSLSKQQRDAIPEFL